MSADGSAAPIRTTCPYCGVGCGVLARPRPDGSVEISGDPAHPANFGRLCSKGSALGETVGLDGRLLRPILRGPAGEREVDWDEALDTVAQRFRRIIDEHGPEAVAFYVSGQLLTEDYYVANKLVKGWLGTANIDTNSRLCMSSAVAGHVRAFGEDVVPCSYTDLETADLLVLVGSNTAWCHPVLYQRILAARERRPEMKIVVIDPRRTSTCEIADLHLPLRAGSDVALFSGLLTYLQQHGHADTTFVEARTQGLLEALPAAGHCTPEDIAVECGVDSSQLSAFYQLFAETAKVVTAFSMGVNQASSGTDKVNAIINCHLLTGRIGQPGMGPFSITGQPNAMGGREVGGMANMLAAHLNLDDARHRSLVRDFWQSPRIAEKPGLKAVDLFQAIGRGEVKAVWIIATNPVVSMPDADAVRDALRRCELVVVSDCVADTDTAKLAHVLLPAAAWGEKDGTVTNTERRISRQRAFLPLPAAARQDWWTLCEFAKRMGFDGFDFQSAHEIFLEHAALSACGNDGDAKAPNRATRCFNLAGLAEIDEFEYAAMAPVQWPVVQKPINLNAATDVDLKYAAVFSTANGRARFVPVQVRAPGSTLSSGYPMVLNTGRVRDQWHTMTRTGRAPRLAGHTPAPVVTVHEQDAANYSLAEGELARVATHWGALTARVRVGTDVSAGTMFVPIHWSDAFAADARVGALVNPIVDPISGEPEFKHTPARIAPWPVQWQGVLLSRTAPELAVVDWWARGAGYQHSRYELAGLTVPASWSIFAKTLFGGSAQQGDWLELEDAANGIYRAALLREGRLEACLFVGRTAALPSTDWLARLFTQPKLEAAERMALLSGRAAGGEDAGPVVCSCFGVCRNTLRHAIRLEGLKTTQQVGKKLRAGTNCGSCLPELRLLIAENISS